MSVPYASDGSGEGRYTLNIVALPYYDDVKEMFFVDFTIGDGHTTRYGPITDAQTANALASELVGSFVAVADRLLAEALAARPSP